MPDQYRLLRSVRQHIPITEGEFNSIRDAKRIVMEVLSGEEKLDMLLENFVEWEQELLSMTLQTAVFGDISWTDIKGRIHRIDRRLLNVMSSARLYLDHSRHSISEVFGNPSQEMDEFTRQTAAEYDAYLGYRAMEAIRNYVQHRGLAVHQLTQDAWFVTDGETGRVRHSLQPFVRPETLKEVGGFKAAVLSELEQIGDEIDLRPLVREYIASLCRVQILVRAVFDSGLQGAVKIFRDALGRISGPDNADPISVIAQRFEGGLPVEQVQVFMALFDRRSQLIRKNSRAEHIVRQFVVAEPKDDFSGAP